MDVKRKKTMTVKEFANYIGVGYVKAYEITRSKDFPSFKVGKKILVISSKVDEWLDDCTGKEF